MKKGWQTKALGEACQLKPPKSEARDKVSAGSLVSFLPMEDMGIDEMFVKAHHAKPLSAVVGSYTYFADGDVLLAKITPCFENGKLGIAHGLTNGIGFGSSEYMVFRPNNALSKEWLYYYLSREVFRVEGAARMSGAVGHKRVSKEFIESYPIPVPPLPEQQRIVGILDAAFEGLATAKANAEKNLLNARCPHSPARSGQPRPRWLSAANSTPNSKRSSISCCPITSTSAWRNWTRQSSTLCSASNTTIPSATPWRIWENQCRSKRFSSGFRSSSMCRRREGCPVWGSASEGERYGLRSKGEGLKIAADSGRNARQDSQNGPAVGNHRHNSGLRPGRSSD